jgi:hypothetical protein
MHRFVAFAHLPSADIERLNGLPVIRRRNCKQLIEKSKMAVQAVRGECGSCASRHIRPGCVAAWQHVAARQMPKCPWRRACAGRNRNPIRRNRVVPKRAGADIARRAANRELSGGAPLLSGVGERSDMGVLRGCSSAVGSKFGGCETSGVCKLCCRRPSHQRRCSLNGLSQRQTQDRSGVERICMLCRTRRRHAARLIERSVMIRLEPLISPCGDPVAVNNLNFSIECSDRDGVAVAEPAKPATPSAQGVTP